MHDSKSVPILVVEDSPEDFEVLERAFKKSGFDIPLQRCKDGQDALDLLYKEGAYENLPKHAKPSLILLDLNMPGLDGHALLESLKDDDANGLSKIPIVVLSTSSSDNDINQSYQRGANSYIQKPDDMKGYVEMVNDIKDYWFSRCSLPTCWVSA